MPSGDHKVSSILLITLSNVGDVLMTTPVMEALHRKYPQAVFDIVADRRSSELFTYCPYRQAVIHRDKHLGWRGTIALITRLRATLYDLIVDLRTDGLSLLLRSHRRLTRRGSRPAGPHAVERHMGVIMQREHLTAIPPIHVWLSPVEHAQAQAAVVSLPGTRWLALGPGARWAPKCWAATKFSELAHHLQHQFDAILLLGNADDKDACRRVAANLPLPHVDLAGKTGLLQAAAVLQQAQVFVGNDSGLGHLAAASGTPTVTVFGPGDPERYHPWHPQARWISSPSGRLTDITASEVAAVVATLLHTG